MKAQLAVLESLVAVAIGIAALSAITYASYTYRSNGMGGVALDNAEFDITAITYRNSTLSACISEWDEACVLHYLAMFREIYSMPYASLQYGNHSAASGSEASCRAMLTYCIPISSASGYGVGCYRLCGG